MPPAMSITTCRLVAESDRRRPPMPRAEARMSLHPGLAQDRSGQLRVKAPSARSFERHYAVLTRSSQAETVGLSFREWWGREEPSVRAIFIRHGQSTGIPCHDQSGIELTELGPQAEQGSGGELGQDARRDRDLALSSHPSDGRSDCRAVSKGAGRGLADPGVHLLPAEPLERNPERGTYAPHRAILGRGRPGVLRRTRSRELPYFAGPGASGLGSTRISPDRCSGVCLQPRPVYPGRAIAGGRCRHERPEEDEEILA